ncbi:MAG: hypothetical protein R2862_06505 [Thermoanaerobaculia bacterium]
MVANGQVPPSTLAWCPGAAGWASSRPTRASTAAATPPPPPPKA